MGSKRETHRKDRQRLRDLLRAKGVPEDEIQRILARKAEDQRRQREIERMATDKPAADLDDTGYRPTYVDPLLKGAARATGATARAVRRRSTTLRHGDVPDGQGQ